MTPFAMQLELVGLPKRYNTMSGTHWAVRAAESQKWHKRLLGRLITQRVQVPPTPLKSAKLVLTRFSSRPPDYDGLVQSFKPIVDALTKCLIIADDSMAVIGAPVYRWEKVPAREGRIRIEVYEVTKIEISNNETDVGA